ncbi:leucine-rich repeat extensin-like protein 5 isoform X2 [Myripristis murdjan]|nr:leucine-rich repeat extensin-like protein 5 isoform X2 [Myripristis murdjan]
MEQSPSLYYGSSTTAVTQPTSNNQNVGFPQYAVSAAYEPAEEVYSAETYQTSYYPTFNNPAPHLSSVDSGWDPEEEPPTSQSVSRTSEPRPNMFLPPPPPTKFQAGELAHMEQIYDHGNSEHETEEQSYMPPPPPPPPFPGPSNPEGFQAGELTHFSSIYEHGDEERETEEHFLPMIPYKMAPQPVESPNQKSVNVPDPDNLEVPEVPAPPVSQMLRPVPGSHYYLFLTGQLPPGTVTHYQSDYEHGRDHWSDFHYERHHFPIDPPPSSPAQKQDFPSDSSFIYQHQEPPQPPSTQPGHEARFATKM